MTAASRNLCALLVSICIASFGLAGCSGSGKAREHWSDAAPKIGACFGAVTETDLDPIRVSDRRDCNSPHMGEITAVSQISGSLSKDSSLPSTDDERFDSAVSTCEEKLADLLPPLAGEVTQLNAQRTTALAGWIQLPTSEGWRSGQRWVACSAQIRPGPALQLVSPLSSALSADVDPSLLACLQPQDDGDYLIVGCSEPHLVELLARYDIDSPSDAPFPGDDVLEPAALEACQDLNVATGTEVILSSDQTFVRFPSERAWADGQRHVDCGHVPASTPS